MGTVYRRKVRICTRCEARLDTTAARRACERAGHPIRIHETPIWWLRYQEAGRVQCVSAQTTDRRVAERQLQLREREAVKRAPVAVVAAPAVGPYSFSEAAADLVADYQMHQKRSLRTLRIRIEKHLRPIFGTASLTTITTPAVRAYITRRQAAGAANATINRDLITLKRMYTLAVQAGKLTAKPYIPLLTEQNVRRGFFTWADVERLIAHLPPSMRGIPAFAFVTGWRTPSEILPLEWRQVDLAGGDVRLDAGTTKNGDGRVFPITRELRRVVEAQQQIATTLQTRGITPRYVFCFTDGRKAGQRISAAAFIHRWWRARAAAGCPERIPHDFRRTAVRNLVRAGVPERVAMQLTGHKTRAVFERYNIVNAGDLAEAAHRLDDYLTRTAGREPGLDVEHVDRPDMPSGNTGTTGSGHHLGRLTGVHQNDIDR